VPADTPFSVVIPAHNEGEVITRCLSSLAADLASGAEVIVVCNGCTDDTAERARAAAPGATVLELGPASKAVAMDAGDDVATSFPRFYVDADVEVSAGALGAVATEMARSGRPAGAPRIELVATGASWPVRAYVDIWRHHPYFGPGLIGAGVYGFSEAGRGRFGRFPALLSEDVYVSGLFEPSERLTVPAAWFRPAMPRRFGDLLRVEARHHAGNAQLEAGGFVGGDEHKGAGWALALARDPRRWPGLAVYLLVTLLARVTGARQHRRGDFRWVKDASSRRADLER
jgi:glycosyltransferase involved in cell wall biosynthesis